MPHSISFYPNILVVKLFLINNIYSMAQLVRRVCKLNINFV